MVLICYDGSPTANRAIPAAHAILGDKHATVLHVWRPPDEFVEPDWFGGASTAVGPPIAQLEALALDRAERVTHEGAELARSAGFTAEPRTQPSVGRIFGSAAGGRQRSRSRSSSTTSRPSGWPVPTVA